MSKEKHEYFGNPNLDNMQPPLPDISLIGDHDVNLNGIKFVNSLRVMDELMEHYKIDKKSDNPWMSLSMHLAHDCVPAMRFQEKRGKTSTWNIWDELALYAVIKLEKYRYPKKSYKEIFGQVHTLVKGTQLSRLIKKETALKTIENRYRIFLKSDGFKGVKELTDNINPAIFNDPMLLACHTIYSSRYHIQ